MSEKAAVIKGHGHVTPNADGSRTRCGGPTICKVCKAELAALKSQPRAEQTLLDALEKISAYAPGSGIKDPGFTKMHMGILARDAIAQHQRILAAATHPADQVAGGVVVSRELLRFLLGESALHGIAFGDPKPPLGKFWWSTELRALLNGGRS